MDRDIKFILAVMFLFVILMFVSIAIDYKRITLLDKLAASCKIEIQNISDVGSEL